MPQIPSGHFHVGEAVLRPIGHLPFMRHQPKRWQLPLQRAVAAIWHTYPGQVPPRSGNTPPSQRQVATGGNFSGFLLLLILILVRRGGLLLRGIGRQRRHGHRLPSQGHISLPTLVQIGGTARVFLIAHTPQLLNIQERK